jgi:hypothetical protein
LSKHLLKTYFVTGKKGIHANKNFKPFQFSLGLLKKIKANHFPARQYIFNIKPFAFSQMALNFLRKHFLFLLRIRNGNAYVANSSNVSGTVKHT